MLVLSFPATGSQRARRHFGATMSHVNEGELRHEKASTSSLVPCVPSFTSHNHSQISFMRVFCHFRPLALTARDDILESRSIMSMKGSCVTTNLRREVLWRVAACVPSFTTQNRSQISFMCLFGNFRPLILNARGDNLPPL